jgi:ABC-type amino acid transport system permease subunit
MGAIADNYFNPQILAQYGPDILGGFWVTVEVALLTILLGIGVGLALAIVRTLRLRPADIVITIFVDIFRTLPSSCSSISACPMPTSSFRPSPPR